MLRQRGAGLPKLLPAPPNVMEQASSGPSIGSASQGVFGVWAIILFSVHPPSFRCQVVSAGVWTQQGEWYPWG